MNVLLWTQCESLFSMFNTCGSAASGVAEEAEGKVHAVHVMEVPHTTFLVYLFVCGGRLIVVDVWRPRRKRTRDPPQRPNATCTRTDAHACAHTRVKHSEVKAHRT